MLSRSLAEVLIADSQPRREGRWRGERGETDAGRGWGGQREGEMERWGIEREMGRQVHGAGERDQSVRNGGLGDLRCRDLGKRAQRGRR